MSFRNYITIVMPVYNGATTLRAVFESLERQAFKDYVKEIVVFDDISTDGSRDIVKNYIKRSAFKVRLLSGGGRGLAGNYNRGIVFSKTPFVLLMHQDIILTGKTCLRDILYPLISHKDYVAACPIYSIQPKVWKNYGFWLKCMHSRYFGMHAHGFGGKFDCYNKNLLLNRIGLFDETHFRTAGEDGNMAQRILQSGLKVFKSSVEILHVHSYGDSFNLSSWIRKECQLSEAYGVNLRLGTMNRSPNSLLLTFFRPTLVILLLFPYTNFLGLVLVIVYSLTYTSRMFREEWRDLRVYSLPLINILILTLSSFYSLKGFVIGRQTL